MRAQKDLSQTHWIFVSKSGSTIETMAMAEFVDQHLRVSGFRKLASCSTVITEFRDSPFFSWAKREGVPLLEVPLDVGGRFSVFTPVGLLPAAIAGLSISEMTEGARWAREQSVMVEALVAQTLSSWRRSESVTLFWAYCDGLRSFGRWMQQLWAESLGKANTRGGGVPLQTSTPIPLVGANDQHSVLQQVMDGPRDKFVWFLRNHRSEVEGPVLDRSLFEPASPLIGRSLGELFSAEADATREALAQRNVKSLTLECENLDSRTIGGLLMLSMLTVATLGEVLDINAFDQPGVELGKSLARSKLLS
jgi:glucose-6-phosphate isomerase